MLALTVPAEAARVYSLALLLEMRQTAAVINGLRGTFPYAQLTSAVVNKKMHPGPTCLRDVPPLSVLAPALRVEPGNDTDSHTPPRHSCVCP